jgi:hypothetical protein
MYGVQFTWWSVIILAGGFALLLGVMLAATTRWEWVLWLPILGSFLLAIYSVPAMAKLIATKPALFYREPFMATLRVIVVLAVIESCWISCKVMARKQRQVEVEQNRKTT